MDLLLYLHNLLMQPYNSMLTMEYHYFNLKTSVIAKLKSSDQMMKINKGYSNLMHQTFSFIILLH